MAAKAILALCAQALLVQSIYSQAIPCANTIGTAIAAEEYALAGNTLAYGAGRIGLAGNPAIANYGLAANSFVPSNGGGFIVQSMSPIAPTGITVLSENAMEGALAVNGEMPFLGAVVVEGVLPTAGAGGINYGCGNGAVGIVSEGVGAGVGPYGPTTSAAGIAPGRGGYGPGLASLGASGLGIGSPGLGFNGLAGPGCGCKGF